MSQDNELKHYGIMGMKWGVRRTQAELDAAAGRRSSRSSKSINKQLEKMSDTQLRNKLNRLNMEKQYKQLTKPEKSAGRKIAEGIIVESAKVVASQYVREHLQNTLDPMLKVKKGGR